MVDRPFKNKMLDREVPGYGLTQAYNPWANPPKYTTVEEALDHVVGHLSRPNKRNEMKAYIHAGVPVSSLAKMASFSGFTQNLYNPDVAELIQPALNMYLTSIAVEDGFMGNFRLTPREEFQDEIDSVTMANEMLQLMEEENPELAREVYSRMDEEESAVMQAREESYRAAAEKQKSRQQGPSGGFIGGAPRLSAADIEASNKALGRGSRLSDEDIQAAENALSKESE